MGSEVIGRDVVGVSFGFFSGSELLSLSVAPLTNPHTFDSLHQPVPNGLYDERMGPLDLHDRCVTCGLTQSACLGHLGHIALTLPVYQPLLFSLSYQLLKAKCWHCHRLKLGRLRVELFTTQLQLLEVGMLEQAQLVEQWQFNSKEGGTTSAEGKTSQGNRGKAGKGRGKGRKDQGKGKGRQSKASRQSSAGSPFIDEEAVEEDRGEEEEEGGGGEEEAREGREGMEELGGSNGQSFPLPSLSSPSSRHSVLLGRLRRLSSGASQSYAHHLRLFGAPPPLTSAALEYRTALLSSFMRDMQQRKCHNCGAFSPRLRKDGHSKIFRLPLGRKERQHNDNLGGRDVDEAPLTSSSYPPLFAHHQRSFEEEAQLLQRIRGGEQRKDGRARGVSGNERVVEEVKGRGRRGVGRTQINGKAAAHSAKNLRRKPPPSQSAKKGRRGNDLDDSEEEEEDEEGNALNDSSEEDEGVGEGRQSNAEEVDEEGDIGGVDRSLLSDDVSALRTEVEAAAELRRVPILMFPTEVEAHMERLWKEEGTVLSHLWGTALNQPRLLHSREVALTYSLLFIRVLAVPPSRFRPPSLLNGVESDHPHNLYLKHIIEADGRIRRMALGRPAAPPARSQEVGSVVDSSPSSPSDALSAASVMDWSVLIETWLALQDSVNSLLDSSKASSPNAPQDGLRQTFEKKEGLFRRNMMGKRVNFAARSVISPDPFLNTNEIGVPELFATQLTFPEPVTSFNVEVLRQAVLNGPDVHPGANAIEDERGVVISLAHKSPLQRAALSKTLLTGGTTLKGGPTSASPLLCKRVLRHIRNGDVMLVNRQPTLHKPSMMTHRVRVLKGRNKQWQTIRMHYANCNSYNADFDGDEMNLHVPQGQLARAEAYTISNTDQQYLVPTDGSPLRGLIQDNVLTGVLLTQLDTWLSRSQFQQLLFQCVEVSPTLPLLTPRPAIHKPVELWSGKQLIGCLLQLLTHGRPPLNLNSKGKVPPGNWAQHKEEAVIVIRQNELMSGVLDKSQFGDAGYGLVHAVYELYGANTAGQLLSISGTSLHSVFAVAGLHVWYR